MNRYKIDCHFEYDRIEKPFGVYVRAGRVLARWRYICSFKTDNDAQAYICGLLSLPREIFSL